ncbi:MAG: hypothetical protein Q8O87_01395 [bacterium]|nr:hypothetical protein [bacterium]
MEPVKSFEFSHESLEKDMERLAGEVQERAAAESPTAHKEAIKSTVGEQIKKMAPVAPDPNEHQSSTVPNYLQAADNSTKLQVEQLIELAWHKGLPAAIKEAKKAGPLYVDALHDALTDKLYDEFKRRKLL